MLGVAEGVNEIEGNSRSRERERKRKYRRKHRLFYSGQENYELEDKKKKRKTVDTFFVSIPLPSLDEATFFSFKQRAGLSSFDRLVSFAAHSSSVQYTPFS